MHRRQKLTARDSGKRLVRCRWLPVAVDETDEHSKSLVSIRTGRLTQMNMIRGTRVWHRLCVRFLVALAAMSASQAVVTAANDWVCACSDQCGEGCAIEFAEPLTGPVDRITDPVVADTTQPVFEPAATAPSLFAEGVGGTLAAQGHAPGYIDWAMPRSQFRLRFDAGWDSNTPDRAEFFYAQYGGPGPGDLGTGVVNTRADFQDIRAYLEIASGNRFSVFAELPVRFLQTDSQPGRGLVSSGDTGGLADIQAGFKYALSADPSHFLTFQLKTYIPTGNARRGLGTDHVSIEPGLLFQSRVNSRMDVFGEIRYWIPIDGSSLGGQDYSSDVVRYGLGAAYTAAETCSVAVSPVVEFVGWSVLDGLVFDDGLLLSKGAATTIVNAKIGVRTMFKSNGSTLYVGYGQALTGPQWYENFLRVEYTIYL
jgi:hypothetical protein